MAPLAAQVAQVRVGSAHVESGSVGALSALLHEGVVDPQLEEALDAEEENRADCQDEGDVQGEAVAVLNMARIRFKQKLVDKALAAARDAKSLFREAEDKVGESGALEFIAEVWDSVSSYEKAVVAAERARQHMKRVGDEAGEARMMFLACQNRILPLNRRSSSDDVSKAAKASAELLEFCRKFKDAKALGSALCVMSQVHVQNERFKEAMEAIEEAVPLFTALNDAQNKASAMLLAARIHFTTHSLKRSLECVQESLGLFRSCSDEQGEKACLELLGSLREFEFRVDGTAAPLTRRVGQSQKVECGALRACVHGGLP
mmetsp:Transcript_72108/g.167108  ORF Transcript_72108/g.167108 Transcript_72108/m.167108 type:complete len:318 (-) Transcript_72108:133-1086(-)